MRVSAVLGFTVALLVGTVALGAILVGLNNQPPIVVNLPPTTTPAAIVTPSPSPTVEPTAITSSSSPSPSAGGSVVPVGTDIGQLAPEFTLPGLSGGEFATAGSKGKPLWVNFMASWCPPCRDELPIMNGYAARYADTGLVVLAIDVREDEAVVDAFVRELNVTFPVGLDGDGTAQSDWGAFALPVHYWIDAEGIVRDGALGGIGPDVMADGLESILPGVEVTP